MIESHHPSRKPGTSRKARRIALAIAAAGALAAAPPASGTAGTDGRATPGQQHGGQLEHLPPVSDDIEVVSKLDLTDVRAGIADVGALGNFAYLAAWAPECLESEDPKARGGGVHVVDVSNPADPRKVAFAPAPANTYTGEGVHVFSMRSAAFTGDVLVMNHEGCDTDLPYPGGFSLYDVSNPRNPKPLALGAGETTQPTDTNVLDEATSHSYHSVQGWAAGDKAYVAGVDNQDLDDIDIWDVSDPRAPKLISETGFEDYPQMQSPLAFGDNVFNHDIQVKQVDGRWLLQVSYWDAGYLTLDVSDPASPKYVADSDFVTPDPLSGFGIPEGNAHQSYWSHDNRFILGADEDFAAYRTDFEITDGPNAGRFSAGEFSWTVPIAQRYPAGVSGPTIYGGSGCPSDGDGDGTVDRDQVPPADSLPADPGEAKIVVFTRGVCFFSEKVESGELAGYDGVIIINSHAGSRNGLLADAFICGSRGHEYTPDVVGMCLGHRAGHLLFDDEPHYSGGNFADIERGTIGARINATTLFDGWGYLHLLRADTLQEVDTYAVDEAYDERFAIGFGDLTIHESKTDATENLAYLAYYSAGVRVVSFGDTGITETGAFIDEGGNDIWGIFPVTIGNERLLLASDRDMGLYVLRYTGPGAAQAPSCDDVDAYTNAGDPVELPLVCRDANTGNRLTLSVDRTPQNGTLTVAGTTATYTPRSGFTGRDTFAFTASDGSLSSRPAQGQVFVGRCARTFVGTDARDLINGTPAGDAVTAKAGNDVVDGLQGDDCLLGEGGSDNLSGSDGDDLLVGGNQSDRLFGEAGDDEMRGGDSRDNMRGSSGDDRMYGEAGNDYVSGGSNDDRLSGGPGRDSLRAEAGNDRVFGGPGDDSIAAGQGADRVSGGSGDDKIDAVDGRRDVIRCGRGFDRVRADRRDRVAGDCERVLRTRRARR